MVEVIATSSKVNISNINVGELSKDKKIAKFIPTSKSLKNSNSLKRLSKKTRLIITKKTKRSDLKKIIEINFVYTLIVYELLKLVLILLDKNMYININKTIGIENNKIFCISALEINLIVVSENMIKKNPIRNVKNLSFW